MPKADKQLNKQSQNDEPFIILDYYIKSDKPTPAMDASDLEKSIFLKGDSDYVQTFGKGLKNYPKNDDILDREIWYLAGEHNYYNKENYFINSIKKVNETVNKGDIIAVVDNDNPTLEALALTKIYEVAKKHCEEKLLGLNLNQKEITAPSIATESTIEEIWIADSKKYKVLIKKLKQEYRETGQPFVTELDGELFWNNSLRGSQKYLMGLLYVCNDLGFINVNNFKDVRLIDICKKTFNLKKLDPGNFPDMRGGKIGQKYEAPFIELLNKL